MDCDSRQTGPSFHASDASRWLSVLAGGMERNGQSIFRVEQLQPSWLPTRQQVLRYLLWSRILGASVCVPVIGALGGVLVGLLDWAGTTQKAQPGPVQKRRPAWRTVFRVFGITVLVTLAYELAYQIFYGWAAGLDGSGLMTTLGFGLVFGLFWGIRGWNNNLNDDVPAPDPLSWSWSRAARGSVVGAVTGLTFGIVFLSLILVGLIDVYYENMSQFWRGGSAFAMSSGLTGALIGLVFGGLERRPHDKRAHSSIRSWFRNAIVGAALLVLVVGLGRPLESGFAGIASSWGRYLGFALLVGLVGFVWYGGLGLVQHYTLRYLLYRKGYLPWRLNRFLEWAADDEGVLRKVDGGFEFSDPSLLKQYAHPANAAGIEFVAAP